MNRRVGLIFLDSLTHCHTLVGNKQHWTSAACTWCSLVPSCRGRGQLGTRLYMIRCHHDVICFHALESVCVLVTIASVWCTVLSAWSVKWRLSPVMSQDDWCLQRDPDLPGGEPAEEPVWDLHTRTDVLSAGQQPRGHVLLVRGSAGMKP